MVLFIILFPIIFFITYISTSKSFPYRVVGNYATMKKEIGQINPKITSINLEKSPGNGFLVNIEISEKMNEDETSKLIENLKVIVLKEKNFKTLLKEWPSPHYFRGLTITVFDIGLIITATDPEWPLYGYPPKDMDKVISLESIYHDKHLYMQPDLKWSDNFKKLFD